MRLRDHPDLEYQWPPSWAAAYSTGDRFLIGDESGTLKGVKVMPGELVLTADYDGRDHSGVLLAQDQEFLTRLAEVLKQHLGEPLEQIGHLEIDASA